MREQDAAKKKVLLETAKKDFLGFYLARLEALVEKNKGYLVLGRVRGTKIENFESCAIFLGLVDVG